MILELSDALFNSLFLENNIQHDDPFISNQVKDLSQVFLNAPTIAFMPYMKYLAPGFIGYTLVDKFYKNSRALFHGIISEHESEYDHESPPKVLFISQQEKRSHG